MQNFADLLDQYNNEKIPKNVFNAALAKYSTNDLNAFLTSLTEKNDRYANMFNNVCDKISTHLVNEFPENRNFNIYGSVIRDIVAKKPREPISIFIENVYDNDKYRQSIIKGDENFFKKSNHEQLTKDTESLNAMFQFKECWDMMTTESHAFIKKMMKMLIDICDKYVDTACNANIIKNAIRA